MELMGFVLAVIALFWMYSLSNRMTELERKLRESKGRESVPEPTVAAHTAFRDRLTEEGVSLPPNGIDPRAVQAEMKRIEEVTAPNALMTWITTNFMMKLGAFLVLCAVGWFVSYAIAEGYIGEAGRILLGLTTGALVLVLGYWRIRTHEHQGAVFTVLGSTIILLTVFAARELYDMFTPGSALLLMFATVVFVAFVSVRFNRLPLALAGLVMAWLAPLFTNSETNDLVPYMSYHLVVVFGTLWVVYLRGWSMLTLTALVTTFLAGAPFLAVWGGDKDIALLFAFVFTAIFFVANILGLIANESEKNRGPHLLIAIGTGAYLILWIVAGADKEWQSLLFVAWMLVFSVGSFIVYRIIERKEPFYIYGATSIALLGAATAAELHGPALTIAFTLEIGLLVYLAVTFFKNTALGVMLAWLFALPVLLSLPSLMSYTWMTGVFHEDCAVLLVLTGALFLASSGFIKKQGNIQTAGVTLLTVAGLYAIALIWLVLHAGTLLDEVLATLFALVIYTTAGLTFYFKGIETGTTWYRTVGIALIALSVLRLLLIEVWHMEVEGRIVTFLVIGVLLLSTAFMGKRKAQVLPDSSS